jgi:hypothetical protein
MDPTGADSMTARKKTAAPAEQKEVTVADLILALASYPQHATVGTSDGYASLMIDTPEHPTEVVQVAYDPEGPTVHHYERPDIVERVIHRSDPLDDFAAAQEFLEWLQTKHYGMPRESTGGGHNEPTTYRDLKPAELAREYATRSAT